jgi:hypothetical protein
MLEMRGVLHRRTVAISGVVRSPGPGDIWGEVVILNEGAGSFGQPWALQLAMVVILVGLAPGTSRVKNSNTKAARLTQIEAIQRHNAVR